jgi:translation initiation factor 1
MKSNDWKDRLSVVYSTNPDYNYETSAAPQPEETAAPGSQNLRVRLDRKNRGGKVVTLVTGFTGREDDLKELGRFLKSRCGVGGAVKEGEIIIQGDFKQRVLELLLAAGYSRTKPIG